MKKSSIVLIACLLLTSVFSTAQTLTHTYRFNAPQITQNEDGSNLIEIPGCFNLGDEGTPLLPWFGADLLLPQGQEITGIKILDVKYGKTIHNIYIMPAPGQFPISIGAPDGYKAVPVQEIYSSSQPYPTSPVDMQTTYFLAGHSIGSFGICPLSYIPANNEVQFIQEITVEIITGSGERASNSQSMLRTSSWINSRLEKITDNPEMLASYSYPQNRDYSEYDILFISNQATLPYFDDYIYFKESTGYIVKSITTEDIYANYTGQDDQEKIRNCIIDYYTNYGIMAVILGGDADPTNAPHRIVPHRGFFGTVDNDYDVPADMYYACLDGSWNDDGDSKWGEPGEDDLFGEVIVGRMCIDSQTEADNMINKHILYQDDPVTADIEKALMVGESLDASTWGGDSKDDVAYGSSNYGYTTVGVSPNFTVEELYERDMNWDKYDIFDQFNNTGCNLLNHLGHSNTTYNMKMYNSDVNTNNFTNDGISRGYSIGYSQGCYNGSFDNRNTSAGSYTEDCFSEKITTIETAEVANVGNSRYGLYSPGTTNGASQYFDRQFYDAIFGEGLTMIGSANGDSKEDNAALIGNNQGLRWCCYELTVFGDPTLDVWTAIPTDITATFPPSVLLGASQITFSTDAPNARIGLMQDSTLIGRGITDGNGDLILDLFDPITSVSNIELSIICHNRNRLEETIVVISNTAYVSYTSHTINDQQGNGNGMPDYGEDMLLSIELTNIGNQDANNVTVFLTSTDPYVSITDSTEFYGNFTAGQSITITDAFAITLSDSIPDNYKVYFTLRAEGSETWISTFYMVACAPQLAFNGFLIDDTGSGNGNGILDPGETASLIIYPVNNGHSTAYNLDNIISTTGDYIIIIDTTWMADSLMPSQQAEAAYTIQVDPVAPLGTLQEILSDLSAEFYSCQEVMILKTGIIVEDWETGDFSRFNWQGGGSAPWAFDTQNPFEGTYCLKSGVIGNEQTSILSLTVNILQDDSVSFYRKVSTEVDYDFLNFYIDSDLKGSWSGEQGWERVAYAVPMGVHTLKWVYDKDEYVTGGSDCAWVDYIILPYISVASANAGPDMEACGAEPTQIFGAANNYNTLTWLTSGTGHFSSIGVLDPIYYASEEDVSNGDVTLTLRATNNQTGHTYDDMLLTLLPVPASPATPEGPDYVNVYNTLISDYTTQEITGATDYIWGLEPDEAGSINGTGINATVNWDNTYTGLAEVMVAVEMDGDTCQSFYSILEVTVDYLTGITDPERDNSFTIYPNPGTGEFHLVYNATSGETLRLRVFDVIGEELLSRELANQGEQDVVIDLGSLQSGVYLMVLEGSDFCDYQKIILRK